MQQNGWALEYVGEELKKDREICLAAVQEIITTFDEIDDEIEEVQEKIEKLLLVKQQIQNEVLPHTFIHDAAKFGLTLLGRGYERSRMECRAGNISARHRIRSIPLYSYSFIQSI